MKAVIIGSTGATGKALVQQLLNNPLYTEVVVLLRKITFPNHPKLKQVVVDFNHLENYAEHIQGDVAFSCLGTTLKDAGSKEAQWKVDFTYQNEFAKIASKNLVNSFVLVSAVGANVQSNFFYNKLKGALEESVKTLAFSQLLIFQPGSLIRPNSNRFGEKIGVSVLNFFNSLGLFKAYKAITVQQLASALIAAVAKYPNQHKTISLKEILSISK